MALKAYARALLPHWDAVGEVMQEASIVMWRKFDQLRSEAEFLPWAKVIVRFEALKARQKFARDRLCFSEDIFDLLAEEENSESSDLIKREEEALKQCLSALTSPQKQLVLLPYQGHGAVQELANESSRTVNSLYKKIGRLHEKLTQCVERRLSAPTLPVKAP